MPVSRKANTAKKKRQWRHIEDSAKSRGYSPGEAARMANGVIKKQARKKKGRKSSR